jgi:hypothetical protein
MTDFDLIMQVSTLSNDLALIDMAEDAMSRIRGENLEPEVQNVYKALEWLREEIESSTREVWADINAG